MNSISIASAAIALTLALPAQESTSRPDQRPDAQAKLPAFEQLRSDWQTANQTYRAELSALRSSEEFEAAKAKKDSEKLRELMRSVVRPDPARFGKRALDLAEKLESDDAIAVLRFTANNLYDEGVFERMVALVEKRHLKHSGLAGILENGRALNHFIGIDKTQALLSRIAAESPHDEPRAWAYYWQANLIKMRRPVQGKEAATPADLARADELMAKAEKLAVGTILGDRIAGPRFEKERLQIGMVAPDVKGVDTDGVSFKLSDYRGKVVVLDFWGFW